MQELRIGANRYSKQAGQPIGVCVKRERQTAGFCEDDEKSADVLSLPDEENTAGSGSDPERESVLRHDLQRRYA